MAIDNHMAPKNAKDTQCKVMANRQARNQNLNQFLHPINAHWPPLHFPIPKHYVVTWHLCYNVHASSWSMPALIVNGLYFLTNPKFILLGNVIHKMCRVLWIECLIWPINLEEITLPSNTASRPNSCTHLITCCPVSWPETKKCSGIPHYACDRISRTVIKQHPWAVNDIPYVFVLWACDIFLFLNIITADWTG